MASLIWDFPGSILSRVVDGDSFYATVQRSSLASFDMGFHIFISAPVTGVATIKFRLDGCNSAPSSTLSGAGAADRLTKLLGNGPFDLLSVGPYKYGDEWMAEVTLADGRSVTDILIDEQWAAPWDGKGAQPIPPWPRTV